MSTQPAKSQQCNEVPDVPARGRCEVHLAEISPVAMFKVGMTPETEQPSVAVEVGPLKELLQPPGFAEFGILHVMKGEQAESKGLHPLGTKLFDGEFANSLFGPCRSFRRTAFDGRRVADHLPFLTDGIEANQRHDPALRIAEVELPDFWFVAKRER